MASVLYFTALKSTELTLVLDKSSLRAVLSSLIIPSACSAPLLQSRAAHMSARLGAGLGRSAADCSTLCRQAAARHLKPDASTCKERN